MPADSPELKNDQNIDFWLFLKKTMNSFRFRLFLFIFLIYIAGATLDVTNTNPGSRFMLTKSIAKYGEFTIREEDRYRYSYLDFSIINRFSNPSFEEGILEEAESWNVLSPNNFRTTTSNRSGNYGFQLNGINGGFEQDIYDLAVHSTYENRMTFWAKKAAISETFLNITVYYSDSSFSAHWVEIAYSFFFQYEIKFTNIPSEKIIDKIRFQNFNSSLVNLDDFHLGYIYSDKPPGVSLLVVPIYWLGEIIAVNFLGIDSSDHFMIDEIIKFLIIVCVLAFGAFTAVKFYDLLRILKISHKNANWTTLILVFGTIYYVYIGTFFSHGLTASFLILAIYYGTRFQLEKDIPSLMFSSVYVGYMVVCDYILLFLLPFLFLYNFIPFPMKIHDLLKNWKGYVKYYTPTIVLYMIPLVICGLLVIYYNFSCFGDPFTSPYNYAWYFSDRQHFAESMFSGLQILLFSRHHGLIHFMPITFICIIGLIPMFRKAPALASLCFSLSIWIILLYSKYYLPTGGLNYGPRQIVTIIPLLIIPFGFFLDIKRKGFSSLKMKEAVKETSITVLKSLTVILAALSFLISAAGNWVGVYPPREDIIDPIWGSSDYVGHVNVLFSWISFSFNANGAIALEFFQNGYGGFKLDAIFITLSTKITWPTASSLAIGEPAAFLAALILALLINPYFNPLSIKHILSKKFTSIISEKRSNYYSILIIITQISLIALFFIWSVLEVLQFLLPSVHGLITASSLNLLDLFSSYYSSVSSLPIINFLSWIFYFSIFTLMKCLIFRDSYSLGNWFVNTCLFVIVSNISWILFNQIDIKMIKDGNSKNINQKEEKFSIMRKLLLTNNYQKIAKILFYFYIVTSIWALHKEIFLFILKNDPLQNFTLHTNLTYVLLYSILILVLMSTKIPLKERDVMQETGESGSITLENPIFKEKSKRYQAQIISLFSVFGLLFMMIYIMRMIIISEFDFSDFMFIIPSLGSSGIKHWFKQSENSVIVFLAIGILLTIIFVLLNLYDYLNTTRKITKAIFKLPNSIDNYLNENFIEKSAIQALSVFGGILIIYVFLLITILFSVLSSVANPALLELHLEEWIIWHSLFILFLLGMIWAIDFYRNATLNS